MKERKDPPDALPPPLSLSRSPTLSLRPLPPNFIHPTLSHPRRSVPLAFNSLELLIDRIQRCSHVTDLNRYRRSLYFSKLQILPSKKSTMLVNLTHTSNPEIPFLRPLRRAHFLFFSVLIHLYTRFSLLSISPTDCFGCIYSDPRQLSRYLESERERETMQNDVSERVCMYRCT